MRTSTSKATSITNSRSITANSYPWLMLVCRSALFLFFQLLIALVLAIVGTPAAWNEAARSLRLR
jgi:hypothetical protein